MPVPGWFVSVSPLDRSAGGVIQLRVSARQHDGAFVRAAIRRDSEAHGHGLPDSSFPGHTGIVRVLDTPTQPTWRCEAAVSIATAAGSGTLSAATCTGAGQIGRASCRERVCQYV